MKLFKNVGLEDLNKIIEQGILPISKTGNNNWEDKKRANNSTDVVYLFDPTTEQNTFVNYGLALLEVNVDGAVKNDFVTNDANIGLYDEYIIDEVQPNEIKKIYLPKLFRDRIADDLFLSEETYSKIVWVDTKVEFLANYTYNNQNELEYQFSITAKITNQSNYLKGSNPNRTLITARFSRYTI